MSEPQYRILRAGERIKAGDEADRMVNPFKDEPSWVPVNPTSIGKIAPDPAYPAHTLYRRRIEEQKE